MLSVSDDLSLGGLSVCVYVCGQSLVYFTFAALGGDHLAQMALVCQSCLDSDYILQC